MASSMFPSTFHLLQMRVSTDKVQANVCDLLKYPCEVKSSNLLHS